MAKDRKKVDESEFDATVKDSKKRKKAGVITALVFVAVLLCVGLYFCFEKVFFVKKIDVKDITGEYENTAMFPYTDEEMLEGLGIEKGMGLYDFSTSEAEEKAKYNLPYIEEINVSRRWPTTVVAKTVLEVPTYYVSVNNNLYIISDSFKVLERTKDFEKIELYSLIFLESNSLHSCIVGEKLGIPADIEKIVDEMYKTFEEFGVQNDITAIDAGDKFNLSVMYGTRYSVKLGKPPIFRSNENWAAALLLTAMQFYGADNIPELSDLCAEFNADQLGVSRCLKKIRTTLTEEK